MSARHLASLLAVLAVGCSPAASDRTVMLTVTYPRDAALDQLALSGRLPTEPVRELSAAVPSPARALAVGQETVALRLPASPTSGTLTVKVGGYAQDALQVEGSVSLDLAALVPTSVALSAPGTDPCALPDGCCGDGLIQASEACDDEGTSGGDGCDEACQVESGYVCVGEPSSCAVDCPSGCEHCGDGVIDADEGCDDGGARSSDGCNAACQIEDGWTCSGEPSTCQPTCGDGTLQTGEGCDDGANVDGDGCDASCQLEAGYACVGEPSNCATVCGDGLIRGDEACDDGGRAPQDGCGPQCQIDSGYTCVGEPSICSALDAGVPDADASVLDAEVPDADVDGGVPDAGFAVLASRWAFPGFPSPAAGECTAVVVQREDDLGVPAASTSSATAQLAIMAGTDVSLYADPDCLSPATQVVLVPGAAEATAWVRVLRVGPIGLSASGAGLDVGTGSGQVRGGPPAVITLVGVPATLEWGTCPATPAVLGFVDAYGNTTAPSADLTVAFDTQPLGAALEVSAAAGCAGPSDQRVVLAGHAAPQVWLVTRAEGAHQLVASAPGLTPATAPVEVLGVNLTCGTSCPAGGCLEVCGANNCPIACTSGCRCQLDCAAQPGTCRPSCGTNALCEIDC
ncbi:MAG: DUF4215 domain-containing protein, partial [Myxococcales bacterium]|nr:DUF4215 domain-containing protein [Myxococcales bacterium]